MISDGDQQIYAFQRQLAQAQQAIQALQQELNVTNSGLVSLTLELEKRVDERTSELRATQEELQRTNSDLLMLTLDLEKRSQDLENEAHQLEAEIVVRKRGEETLQKRTLDLETANKELESFSYSVSHDLRAPLRGIDGYSGILLREYASLIPEEGQQRLRSMRDLAQHMGRLIDDLLAFSRLGRQPLQKQSVDVTMLVNEILEDLKDDMAERQVKIVLGDLPGCQGDRNLLKQVLINLLSNAIKYTRAREVSRIEVGTFRENDELVYFVRDNGVGFDMKYADKLFGVFQRLHSSEEFEGTGVGLAIVKRIINRHGGRVWADGIVDVGAGFFFTLEDGNTNG